MLINDFFTHFGDFEKLKFHTPVQENFLSKFQWPKYNPRKPIERYGLSITSLDGGVSGIPDLDSLREYNNINGTDHREKDFNIFTEAAEYSNVKEILSNFELGRCHFIRLESGGFFPWHRDGGVLMPQGSFRVLCTLDYDPNSFVWLQEDKQLKFEKGNWYIINTTKRHAVFSFKPQTIIVANVLNTANNVQKIIKCLDVL